MPSSSGRKFTTALRSAGALLVAATMCAVTAGCGGGGSSGGGDDKTLNMLTWETYHETAWLDEFTKETGIKVNAVNVGSPAEMFAKVKANPNQFDIALVTSGWYDNYAQDDLLVPIDESKITESPNPGFDWQSVASANDTPYGILYNWGDQPLTWLAGSIPDDPALAKYLDDQGRPNDWNILWDPAFTGRVSVFDDPTSVMPMIPIALGFEDPYNLTPEQLTQVQEKLDALRPQIKRLTSGFNDQATQFTTGEATIGYLNIISEVAMLKEQGKTLEVNHQVKGGVPAWSDNYSITKGGAEKSDAVYEFINYTLRVPWQARFVAATGNSAALGLEQAESPEAVAAGLTPELLQATLIPATAAGDALFKGLKFFEPVEDLNKRVDIWNQFKLGMSS